MQVTTRYSSVHTKLQKTVFVFTYLCAVLAFYTVVKDPERNITLLNVIKKARAGGVPKANIESALQKVARIFFHTKKELKG